MTYLVFISSLREGNFDAYKCSLSELMPYLFANDNTHYSRWGTIHLHDMVTLQETNPSIYDEFISGNFVLHESCGRFLGVALDQAHEHKNCVIKLDGGIIGITENESALLRWMTSGPAICQLIQSSELLTQNKLTKYSHHDDIPSAQKNFFQDVKQMTDTIEQFGNPFQEDSKELVRLDSQFNFR